MRAAVVKAVGEVDVVTVADPTPAPGQVVVAVDAVGICGTDLHILRGEFAPTLPVIPGHEFAGRVVAIGPDADDMHQLREGDRVAVDPSLYCNECRYCRSGHNNLCQRWGAIGVTVSGGAAEYVAVPAANCVKLPEHVSTVDAALIEPLACAVRGYDVLTSQLGSRVLLYGAGTMGLIMLQLAARVGAVSVDVVEVNPDRLEIARRLGSSRIATDADELDQPDGWQLVVDATGNAAAIQDGLGRVAPGGTFLQFGVADYDARVTIDPYRVYNQEITITGSMAVLRSFERAADLFAAGAIDSAALVTDVYRLEEYPFALDRFAGGHGIKTQVRP